MNWSYSRLLDFEQCPFRYAMKFIQRVPEEKSEAADRGTAIHQLAEDFVAGRKQKLPAELKKFEEDFESLHRRFKEGLVSLEGEWGFDADWLPTNYKTAWLRMKADAVSFMSPSKQHAVVIDYKTGKRFGNEIKHGEQVQLYALATAIREPTVQNITVELWYLDKDELTTTEYKRSHAMSFVKPFGQRAARIEKAHKLNAFPPNPNQFTCQWCPYGPNKGKQCEHGVTASMSISEYRRKFA